MIEIEMLVRKSRWKRKDEGVKGSSLATVPELTGEFPHLVEAGPRWVVSDLGV